MILITPVYPGIVWKIIIQVLMDKVYPRLMKMSPKKPIIIAEFGVTQGYPGKDQSLWAEEALTNILKSQWSNVIGFSWWNGEWQNDDSPKNNSVMSLEANPSSDALPKSAGRLNSESVRN